MANTKIVPIKVDFTRLPESNCVWKLLCINLFEYTDWIFFSGAFFSSNSLDNFLHLLDVYISRFEGVGQQREIDLIIRSLATHNEEVIWIFLWVDHEAMILHQIAEINHAWQAKIIFKLVDNFELPWAKLYCLDAVYDVNVPIRWNEKATIAIAYPRLLYISKYLIFDVDFDVAVPFVEEDDEVTVFILFVLILWSRLEDYCLEWYKPSDRRLMQVSGINELLVIIPHL